MLRIRFCAEIIRYKQILVGFVVLVFCQSLLAVNEYHVKQYQVDNGMCDNSITTISRDNRGFLWFGTNNGLVRYDGSEFELFRHDPFDSTTIKSNLITSIGVASTQGIYVGSNDGKVGYWRGINADFEVVNDMVGGDVRGGVTKIYDYSADLLLYGTNNSVTALVSELTTGEKPKVVKRALTQMLSSSAIISNGVQGSKILFGWSDSLAVFNVLTKKYEPLASNYGRIKGSILAIEYLDKARYFVMSSSGLYVIELSNSSYNVVGEMVEGGYVAVVRGKRGDFWLAKGDLIKRVSIQGSRFVFQSEIVTHDLLQGITVLKEDPQGVLWVGTKRKGVVQVRFEPSAFLGTNIGNSEVEIAAFAEGVARDLFVATSKCDLYRVSSDGLMVDPINITSVQEQIPLGVKTMVELPDRRLLIGGLQGASIVDLAKRRAEKCSFKGFRSSSNIEVNSVVLGKKGEVWVGTPEGVGQLSGNEIVSVFNSSLIISSLISDNHNNLWIGTSTGLFKKDSGLSVIKKVTGGDSFGSRVLSLPIVSLVVGKDGVAVIGTKNGLFRYNISTNRVDQLEVDNELFAKGFITNVQLDRLNNVWVTAHNSVFMLGKNGQARHYGIDEGMRSQGIPTGAALVTSDGKLFVGGGNTFCVSTSLELKSGVNVRPEVVLSNVTLLFDDSVEKRYYDVLSPFILKEREGFSLKFKFGLNDFISSKNNRFKYRVNGGDGEYIDLKLANTLTLSDLESGEYILEVKGSFDGATWSDEPLLLKFVVTPPLHKSGFAIAFYILAILFVGQLVYNVGFRYLRQIRKSLTEEKNSKKLFEAQSVKLALSNKSLTDSIDYAKRIQVALLPSIAEIRRLIPKSFLYYRPKDIVSGDFYAVFEVKGKVVVVAADCTGHGVPGAFMSMIGYDMLKNIITVQDVVDPGQILQLMNNGVVSMLRHSSGYEFGHELDVNDGMDMSVCVIDKEKKQLYFSGAVNPLYLIRDNEILIYKGSRFAVGQADVDGENLFPTEVIDLQSDDVCYLFSDGYVDQFGGSEGKKFKYRRFRHLLLRIHRLGHASQSSNVESMMNDWMNSGGVRYPQVDDMLLIGFSPLGID